MNKNKQLMEDIYKIGLEYDDAITIEQLEALYEKKKNTKLKRTDMVYILNVLENARFCYIKNENNTIVTKMRRQETIKKLINLSDVDFLIYTKVENSHSNGIWTADLRKQTKLLVNNIHVKNRKMYILYDLEASEKVIGGSFYTDGEFDKKAVTYIRDNICFYLRNNNYASVSSVIKYVKQMNERMNYYTESDMQQVIDTLIYEDKIKICKNNFNEDSLYLYNSFGEDEHVNESADKTFNLNNDENVKCRTDTHEDDENLNEHTIHYYCIPTVPCFSCELFSKCNSDVNTEINPSSCVYLSKYLELEVRKRQKTKEDRKKI